MDKVKLHALVSGGSFGRRANAWSDFTVAAVNVAVATPAAMATAWAMVVS